MEPFSKDDPLYDLLGKSRKVEPRANFTQDVMRSIRNTPQKRSWWENAQAWFAEVNLTRVSYAAAVIAVIAIAGMWIKSGDSPSTQIAVVEPVATEGAVAVQPENTDVDSSQESSVLAELNSMDEFSDLLASQDTSSLTDGEIAMLLY